ncbi:hypothetical protein FJZ23_02775 [Candidatus Parcubacteria bacterium]|nr:hypothetical protein [Candidatus Parcubacteria bacterium]
MLQIFLQPEAQLVRSDQFDPLAYVWILWIPVAVFALTGGVLLLRWFLRRLYDARSATFSSRTLLVTLPKFRREEESERGPQREQVQETISAAENIFAAIGGLKAQRGLRAWFIGRDDEVAFEIVVQKKLIKFFVTIPRHMQSFVEQQISAAYPDAFLEEVEDFNIFSPSGETLGSYLTPTRPYAFPIKTYRKMDQDPLNSLTNVLSKVPEGDAAAFQFVVRSSYKTWRKYGVDLATRMQQGISMEDALKGKKKGQKSFLQQIGLGSKQPQEPESDYRLSPQEEEAVKGLQEKASKAGLDVSIRAVASSAQPGASEALLQDMLNAFSQYNIYQYGNAFQIVMPSLAPLARKFIYRTVDEKYKTVMNSEELASLWHLPLPWTETPNIKWLGARSGPVPAGVPTGPEEGGTLELGYNMYRGIRTPVWMKEKDRTRHMYLIGKSGSGKSQTIAKYAIQDIKAGHGVAVVDPHGDLIEQILGNIPRERLDDVIVFNPSDVERPMGLNMLEAKDEALKDFAVQEMIAIFYKLFTAEIIGPMFEHHMRNVMLTLMSDPENPGTIIEIPRMFSDPDFQNKWRKKVKDPVVQSYWVNEVDKTSDFHKSEMLGYLISKVGRFVENEMMRNIIGQQHSSFDFREVMDKKKILLVNLSKGKTGDVNAELLGLIIVSKLQMAALGRADLPEAERHDFFLYIDEFQNFITDSIATILSEARKYRLNLIIAHQYIGQLVRNNDTKIKDAVFGNVGTTFVARIGPEDVETLEKVYTPEFSGYDLMNSDKFTWYVKMVVDNSQVKPFTMNLATAGDGDRELAGGIKELSRLRFGRDRRLVEADILERTALVSMSLPSTPLVGDR